MVSDRIRERYLRDALPVRLGGLAADLARIASCVDEPDDYNALISLLDEGKCFAEWTAADAPLDVQERLAEIQISLAWWQLRYRLGRPPTGVRAKAKDWSDQLLSLSGLV